MTAVTEIKMSTLSKTNWFTTIANARQEKKKRQADSVDQQSRQKKKAMAILSLKRLTAWDLIFGLDTQTYKIPNTLTE